MSENLLRHKRAPTNDPNKVLVSRYAQGIYNPKSNSAKRQVLGETTNNIEPPTKRSKTMKPPVVAQPVVQPKPVNHVAAAKQAIKEKQQVKDRRIRKTGMLPTYSHVKSKVNSNINMARSADSNSSLMNDSTIVDDSMDIDMSSISNSRLSANTSVLSTSTLVQSKLYSPLAGSLQHVNRVSKLSELTRSNSLAINVSPIKKELKKSFTFPSVYSENSRKLKPLIKVKPKLVYRDPIKVEEYAAEIFIYWKELEIQTLPDPMYMSRQPELDWGMRNALISWIFQVHAYFRLLPETLYLTTNLIDRTLTHKSISMSKLQLVGVTSLLIASKYEEIQSPMISDMVYMTANGYKEEEIKTAERHLLGIVSYKIGYPNPLNFLKRFNCEEKERHLCEYFLESMMLGKQFIGYPPSLQAAAAYFLTLKTLYDKSWSRILVDISGYHEAQLLECVYALLEFLNSEENMTAYEKFSSSVYSKVSVSMHNFLRQRSQ